MLVEQHRAVDDLFQRLERADGEEHQTLFEELADAIAIHATIEEHIFYPAVRERRTEEILLESLEEHLAIKRILADCLRLSVDDDVFRAKLRVLREEVEHHVEDEERELLPKVRDVLDEDLLEGLANEMTALAVELEQRGAPRERVRDETHAAPPLQPV